MVETGDEDVLVDDVLVDDLLIDEDVLVDDVLEAVKLLLGVPKDWQVVPRSVTSLNVSAVDPLTTPYLVPVAEVRV